MLGRLHDFDAVSAIATRGAQVRHLQLSVLDRSRSFKQSFAAQYLCATGSDKEAFEHAQGVMASLRAMAQAGQSDLLYFDEAGFGPNPPIQYG